MFKGSRVWTLGLGIWVLEFGIWNLGFGIWILEFGIWDLGFGTCGIAEVALSPLSLSPLS
jgi:hypothetical protein